MTDVLLQEYERAILIKNGKALRWLEAGRHKWWDFGAKWEVERFNLNSGYAYSTPTLERMVPKETGELVEIAEHEIGILKLNNQANSCLKPGRYILWKGYNNASLQRYDLRELFLDIPTDHLALVPADKAARHIVYNYQKGLLYIDGRFEKELPEGAYTLSRWRRNVDLRLIESREQEIQIVGQEVMTKDKVSLRLNLIIKHRITDARLSIEGVDNLYNALYSETQTIARAHIAGQTIDDLLEQRVNIANAMREEIKPRADLWGIQVQRLDIKDVILPGEMKTLLNRVIEAEKEATANNILRREETAATRSLANTAKMLERNPTLLRLKELETWKEIAGKIQKITLIANTQDITRQLSLADSAINVDSKDD